MRYEWFIARRYLKPQGGATFIFHLTVFSIAGVALGVASLITVLSVMNGFGNDLRGKIMQGQSHVLLTYPNGLENAESLIPEFSAIDNVAACAPVIMRQGMLFPSDFPNPSSLFVLIFGVDPAQETQVTDLGGKVIAGSLDGLAVREKTSSPNQPVKITDLISPEPPGILIGKELASHLFGVWEEKDDREGKESAYQQVLGYRLTLVTLPNDELALSMGKPNMEIFRIVGIFETGHFEFDYSWVFISIPAAQYLTDQPGKISHIRFRLNHFSEEATLATIAEIHQRNNELVGVGYPKSWMDLDRTFFEALRIEKATMNYILKIIILVATFNIIATLFMIVMAKTRDVGLLRAIGASRRSVLKIFLLVGILIGMIGTLTGVFGGLGMCIVIQTFPPELPGNGQVYNLKYLPCEMEFMDFFWVSLYTFCISFLASLYPAFRAARLMPVDAIRYS